MEFIRGHYSLLPRHRGCALTIGNFDGVHRGHQAIIQQLQQSARERQLPATLLTFEPQPQEFFRAAAPPPRLTRLREKLTLLAGTGLDRVVCLRFDQRLARTPATVFIEELLVERLGVRYLLVGDDFRFGQGGAGNIDTLREAAHRHGFEVARLDTFQVLEQRVSSTRIRQHLGCGELAAAATLLGRPYGISGRVRRGDQLGRQLGFPTANVDLGGRAPPLAGVFAVRVHGCNGTSHFGMANVGTRPTVNGLETRLEVYLFDFVGDLYGQLLSVEFLHRTRTERRFASVTELQAQLHRDASGIRHWLNAHHSAHP